MIKHSRIFKVSLIVLSIIVSVLLISAFFFKLIIKEAFGPKVSEITIPLNNNSNLECKQTYNADLAAVFYDIDFSLVESTGDPIYLGKSTFSTDKWQNFCKISFLRNWIILQISEPGSYAEIFTYNRNSSSRKDTIFSPHELKNDSLWSKLNLEQPAWVYPGSSNIDSIDYYKFYIKYQYREGLYEPFVFYSQNIEYELDTLTGKIKTIKIFDKIKK